VSSAEGPHQSKTQLSTKVARGVAWAASAQAIIAVADIVSVMLVMALWVPVEDWGIAALAFPFYTMLDTAADLGVTSSLIQRDDHTPERVSTVFWFNMIISSGLFLVLLGVGPLYGHIVGHQIVGWLLVAYGGKLIFQNVYAIPFALLRKELRFNDIAVARVLAHLAESAARCVFAYLGYTIWCFTLAALTRAFVFGVIMQIRHPFFPRLLFKPREVVQYIRFGIRSAASQVLYQLYTNLDYPIVGYYFGAWANGIYAGAYFFVLEPVKTIANVVIDVAFPTFARLRSDPPQLVDQFIKFTRLNLIAVLPFIVLIALVLPEFLRVFYVGSKWTVDDVPYVVNAAYILCLVGVLRALAFLGPPLLDGIGHPERTLRYMVVASVVVPGMFLLAANLLGDHIGFLSVAVGWAVGYPIAFAALSFLVIKAIRLPVGEYLRAAWGIVGCCLGGFVAGLVVKQLLGDQSDGVRMAIVAATAVVVIGLLLAFWQNITPRSIGRSLKG
jgi:O-antigen/teichoic acid export membrane protein